jgi:hypothetical protein
MVSHEPGDVVNWVQRIGTQGWIILESYPVLTFRCWRAGEPLPPMGTEFAGRIFGERGELRWTRDGSSFDLWLLEDVAAAEDGAARFEVETRYYYALGYWSKQRYWEPKLASEGVQYPIGDGQDGDRPRFRVREYYRSVPAEWPSDLDAFENLVNQPSLAAYRLVGFDAGKDGE